MADGARAPAEGPSRGDIWLADLGPTRGHERAGVRPSLVISTDLFNRGPDRLVVVLPLRTTRPETPLHVGVYLPEGGLRQVSYVQCEDVRSISTERLIQRWGSV